MSWRDQANDLTTYLWTTRKASPVEIRAEIRKAIGVVVPETKEDALEGLLDSEVREVLKELKPTEREMDSAKSDLCHECFSVAGECEDDCGQREPSPYDPPATEQEMTDLVEEALSGRLEELCSRGPDWKARSFEEAGLMSGNKGLVVKVGRAEFQITVVRSK